MAMAAAGSGMRYSLDDVQSIRLAATNPLTATRFSPTPSMVFNNLTSSPSNKNLAFAHKTMVVIVDGSLVGGGDAAGGKAVRLGASPATGLKWVALGASPMLVVTTESGFQIWDSGCDKLMFFAESRDGISAEAARSALQSPVATAGRSGFPGIGTSSGASFAAAGDAKGHPACHGIGASHVARTVLVGCGGGVMVAQASASLTMFAMLPRVEAYATAEVTDLCVDESGVKMVTGASDGTVSIWDARTTVKIKDFVPASDAVEAPVTGVVVRGDLVAAADVLGRLRLFRFSAETALASLDCHPRAISALALHPRDYLFATASEDSVINLWAMPEAAAGGSRLEHRAALEVSDHPVTGLAFTSDGELAVAAYDIVYLRVLRKS